MPRSVDLPPDAFVGRHRELASLTRLLGSTRSRTRSVLIQGEAGIGKTRLAAEFLERAREQGTRVLQGSCYQVAEAGPYFPLRQILAQLRKSDSTPVEFLRGLVDAALGQGQWGQLSEDVRARRARFLSALSDAILEEAGAEESVLLIEDLQWADVGTLLVLNSLFDMRGTGLMIVCTVRSNEALDVAVRELIARIEQRSRRLVLHGLALRDVLQLVASIAGPGHISEEESRALHGFTKGNPMLLHEMLLHLEESGLLEQRSVQEVIAQVPIPRSLDHFVDLRLRGLPRTVLRSLSACSVVGMEFKTDLIARVIGASRPDTEERLEIAADRGIVQSVGASASGRYRLAHPLFAKRLYDMLPASDRRALHRKVATSGHAWLSVDDLARHYALGLGAAGGRKAIDYCRAAAEEAERVLAYEMAAHFWELGIRCTRSRSKRTRAELFRRQGWALWATGRWAQAAEVWTNAVSLYAALGDRAAEAELALALGDMHRWRSELNESERWLRRALSLGRATQPERGRALALLGGICGFRGDPGAAALLEEAEGLLGRHGGDPTADYWLSYGFRVAGDHSKAYAVAKRGLREAQRGGHAGAATLLAATLVHYELSQLRPKPAQSYVRIGKRAAEKNDPTTLINSGAGEALFLGYSGRWDRVAGVCEQWMARVRLASNYQAATARIFWAEAKLALGEPTAAEGAMRRALPDVAEMRPIAALHLARVWARLGARQEAANLAKRYLPLVASSPRTTVAAGRAVLGDVAASVDEPKLWRTCYELLRREPFPVVMAYSPLSVQRVLGRLASRRGLWVEAMAHFDTALHQLDEGKAWWELALTCLDYAAMRRVRGRRGDADRAAALELQAKAILAELGIQHPASHQVGLIPDNGNRFGLTVRELEVLALVARGRRNAEIAEELSLSPGTVNRHVENIFVKMDVNNRTEAVIRAVEEGLVGPKASHVRATANPSS